MPSRYVPPALRKQEGSEEHKASSHEEELQARALADLKIQHDDGLLTPHDIHCHFWPDHDYPTSTRSTLNDSAATPGQLSYLVLFYGANPRWESDKIIFAKSNLELLTGDILPVEAAADVGEEENLRHASKGAGSLPDEKAATTEGMPIESNQTKKPESTEQKPVAVFYQTRIGARTNKFLGWHKVIKLDRLQPKTPELVRMLEQKWTAKDRFGNEKPRQRDSRGWQESLGHEWAVIKMEQCVGPDIYVQHVEEANLDKNGKLIVKESKHVGDTSKEARVATQS